MTTIVRLYSVTGIQPQSLAKALKARVLSAQPVQAAKELRHLASSVICANDTVATINCF